MYLANFFRWVFGLAALAIVSFFGLICIILVRGYIHAPDPKICTHVPSADIVMNGKQLSIPVQKTHYLMFPPPKDGSSLPRLVSPDYSAFPEPTKGFCAEDIAGRSKIDSVLLDKTANKKIAEQLTLPSAESLSGFKFGNAIRGWGPPNPISLDSTDSNHFRRTKPFNEVLNRQYMETAGWLKDEYRIASSCAVYPHVTDKTCIIKVKLKSSGLVFEAWGLKIPDWPQENQPPPAVFIEFAEKIPAILDLFEKP